MLADVKGIKGHKVPHIIYLQSGHLGDFKFPHYEWKV